MTDFNEDYTAPEENEEFEGNEETPSGEETPAGTPESTPAAPAADSITMSRQEYNQIVAAMATMQARMPQEQEPEPQPQLSKEELEDMSKAEFAQHIHQTQVQPMMQLVAQLGLRAEIADCKDAHSDFGEYQNDAFNIAANYPALTLEQAYYIAKQQRGEAAPATPPATPPAQQQQKPTPPPPANKPSGKPSSMQPTGEMSARQAALEAAKELGYE